MSFIQTSSRIKRGRGGMLTLITSRAPLPLMAFGSTPTKHWTSAMAHVTTINSRRRLFRIVSGMFQLVKILTHKPCPSTVGLSISLTIVLIAQFSQMYIIESLIPTPYTAPSRLKWLRNGSQQITAALWSLAGVLSQVWVSSDRDGSLIPTQTTRAWATLLLQSWWATCSACHFLVLTFAVTMVMLPTNFASDGTTSVPSTPCPETTKASIRMARSLTLSKIFQPGVTLGMLTQWGTRWEQNSP